MSLQEDPTPQTHLQSGQYLHISLWDPEQRTLSTCAWIPGPWKLWENKCRCLCIEWNFYLSAVSRSRYVNSSTVYFWKCASNCYYNYSQTKPCIIINGLGWDNSFCEVLNTYGTYLIWDIQKKYKLQQSWMKILLSWHSIMTIKFL